MSRPAVRLTSVLLTCLSPVICLSDPVFAQESESGSSPPAATSADETEGQEKAPAGEESPATSGDETEAAEAESEEAVPEGHSYHGDVFNEGPRQAAYLMEGVGQVEFPVTTAHEEAQQFVTQGVAQLHGFWFFESERSFRQAAAIDPDCAMAYWGMAMSNLRNEDRAKDFIAEAKERVKGVSKRERSYIEALERYLNADTGDKDKKRKRCERYVKDLEDLILEHPDDIEARAFLCNFFWTARREGLETVSYLTIDAMLQDIFDVRPEHPAHHFRIHLWDAKKAEKALQSAAACGPAAPSIAHMWHMPGHIYSRLKRYQDAVFQQEASARVDHAHMMKDRVMPDQIHNFAHNNEWCIRNLVYIGRATDALNLALNMISLPRHPEFNTIDKSGSYKYGRQRVLTVLRAFRMHEELASLADSPWLSPTGNDDIDLETDRAVASSLIMIGENDRGAAVRERIAGLLEEQKEAKKKAGDEAAAKAEEDGKDEKEVKKARSSAEGRFSTKIRNLTKALQEIDGRTQLTEGNFEEAVTLLTKAGSVPVEELAMAMLKAGQNDKAAKKIRDHVRTHRNEVLPLAAAVEILWSVGEKDEARKQFEALRKISEPVEADHPVFAALTPIAEELGWGAQWVTARETPDDLGGRPDLNALGPFRWEPVNAEYWRLPDTDNNPVSLSDFRGRPTVVIFYLGYGCLHCAEQLNAVAPRAAEFRDAGFDIVAISTDRQELLHNAYKDLPERFPFPLLADPELAAFRAYRCFDDFEEQPLHGTFVLDSDGKIRWQDISYQPFMNVDFLLEEAKRLIAQDSTGIRTPGSSEPSDDATGEE